jgi:arylsulfatase A-like enzyme
MKAGNARHPYWTAALAGGTLFLWFGVLEASYLLFFEGALIKYAGMNDWVRLFANLDSGLFLLAGLLYGAIGLPVGVLWWMGVSRTAEALRRLRRREPREARDFYDLFLYVVLSLFFFLSFLALLLLGPMINPESAKIPFPVRFLLDGLICWSIFRIMYWILNRLLSLPLVRILRRPAVQGGFGALTLLALLALMVLPPILAPPTAELAVRQTYAPERTPPVVFIVLDTARADHFSSYGYPRETTPRFDELTRTSVQFMDAVSASPWTLPSHASMFTGLYQRSHGASIKHFQLDREFITLAEFLRASGYYTFGLSSNPMVGEVTALNQGFDRFEEVWRHQGRDSLTLVKLFNSLRSLPTDKGSREINRIVEKWLDDPGNTEKPFFLFINYLETHGPYKPPPEFRDRFVNLDREGAPPEQVNIYDDRYVKYFTGDVELTELELDDLRSLYDGELAYVDMRLGELLDHLKKKGILDRAVVIVLADHGENLGEHRMTDHQLSVYDTVLRVPLALRYPPLLPAGKKVAGTVQLNALFPTLAEILGVAPESLQIPFSNPSLLPMIRQDAPGLAVAFSEYKSPQEILKILKYKVPDFDTSVLDRDLVSARTDPLKYILTSNGTDELYGLDKDPGEERNLCQGKDCQAGQPLRNAIDQWMKQTPEYEPGENASSISDQKDPEALKKLRSLGYVQ